MNWYYICTKYTPTIQEVLILQISNPFEGIYFYVNICEIVAAAHIFEMGSQANAFIIFDAFL